MAIAKYIDHTLLKADARKEDIEKLCSEAFHNGFASVCVNSCWVPLASELLAGTDVKVCTVVGFPLGAASGKAKAAEAAEAAKQGAVEIDMVMNIGMLKSGMLDDAKEDIQEVRDAVKGKTLKVIIETCLLTDEEKREACRLAAEAGADFVKTSTGFSTGGATVHDVALMKEAVAPYGLKVKASGGIRNYRDAKAMIDAGADRIGASAGIAIVKEENAEG